MRKVTHIRGEVSRNRYSPFTVHQSAQCRIAAVGTNNQLGCKLFGSAITFHASNPRHGIILVEQFRYSKSLYCRNALLIACVLEQDVIQMLAPHT
ncbi:hypothetical protein D3C85_1375360 [compost metagenome]